MLAALSRIPYKYRRKVARIWGKRGNISQQISRRNRDLDYETICFRILDNSRGEILRHGITYTSQNLNGDTWQISKSKRGTLKQVDIIKNGDIIFIGGLRNITRGMKRQKL